MGVAGRHRGREQQGAGLKEKYFFPQTILRGDRALPIGIKVVMKTKLLALPPLAPPSRQDRNQSRGLQNHSSKQTGRRCRGEKGHGSLQTLLPVMSTHSKELS